MKNMHFRGSWAAGIAGLLALVLLGVQSSGGFPPAARARAAAPRGPSVPGVSTARNDTLYEAGVQLYAQGRLAEARRAFRALLRRNPRDVSARRAVDRVEAELIAAGRSGLRSAR
jgi:TolA-binding protein